MFIPVGVFLIKKRHAKIHLGGRNKSKKTSQCASVMLILLSIGLILVLKDCA